MPAPSVPLTLPQQDAPDARRARAQELEAARRAYHPWRPEASADGSLRPLRLDASFTWRGPTVPAQEQFWRTATNATGIGMVMGRLSMGFRARARWHRLRGAATPATLTDAYLPMFSADQQAELPLGGDTWTDEGFALQRLYGTAPYLLRRVDGGLPGHARVRDADVAAVLPEGTSLDGLRRAERLFMVDLADAFEGCLGLPALEDAGIRTAPLSLFWLDGETLRPLAIQLRPTDAHVFTPASSPGAWLAAKLFANQAETIAHVAGVHTAGVWSFGQTVVAMRRTMSTRHPIHAFAMPWTQEFVAMSALLKIGDVPSPPWKTLGGPLGGRFWETFRLDDFHVERRFADRGIDGLPVFPWRDAMRDLWQTMRRYTQRVVETAYPDDAAVQDDVELQAWARVLHSPAACHLRASELEATGGRFVGREPLVDVLTTLHFFLSVWHGYDAFHWPWFAWIPASPMTFDLRPPTTDVDLPMSTLLAALADPTHPQAVEQAAGVLAVRARWSHSALSTGGPDARSLPPVDAHLAGLPAAQAHHRAWFEELDAVERAIDARDARLTAAGHLPTPAACRPTNCAGNLWY